MSKTWSRLSASQQHQSSNSRVVQNGSSPASVGGVFAENGAVALVSAAGASGGSADGPSGGTPSVETAEAVYELTYPLWVALYAYEAMMADELSFQRGEILEIINNTQYEWWWFACSRATNRRGYIPYSHIVPFESLESERYVLTTQLVAFSRRVIQKLLRGPK